MKSKGLGAFGAILLVATALFVYFDHRKEQRAAAARAATLAEQQIDEMRRANELAEEAAREQYSERLRVESEQRSADLHNTFAEIARKRTERETERKNRVAEFVRESTEREKIAAMEEANRIAKQAADDQRFRDAQLRIRQLR